MLPPPRENERASENTHTTNEKYTLSLSQCFGYIFRLRFLAARSRQTMAIPSFLCAPCTSRSVISAFFTNATDATANLADELFLFLIISSLSRAGSV
jgi:hypothetical protein